MKIYLKYKNNQKLNRNLKNFQNVQKFIKNVLKLLKRR